MSNHRAPRRGSADVSGTPARAGTSDSTTTPATGSTVGKRRAVRHSASRGPLFRRFPSAPVMLGIAALTISATGAVSMSDNGVITDTGSNLVAANALTGTTSTSSSSAAEERRQAVSRDSRRDALKDATTKELQAAVEQQAQQRNAELAKLAKSAEKQAAKIALNAWGLPVSGYRLTAGFGQSSGLWANTHTRARPSRQRRRRCACAASPSSSGTPASRSTPKSGSTTRDGCCASASSRTA